MSSVDERFAERRSSTRPSVPWWVGVVAAVVVLLAVVVTMSRSHVDGYGFAEDQNAKDRAATEGRQLGTTCVGWPGDVMPSAPVADVQGAVTFWGVRDAFRMKNPGPEAVEVEIEAADGKVRVRDGSGTAEGDQVLRFELAPGADASFTASCATTELTATIADPAGTGFTVATGAAESPLVIEKQPSA
jgi:hypothetical protein